MAASSDNSSRSANIATAVAVLLCYGVIVVGAGHGIAPLGLMITYGYLSFPIVGGIALLVASALATSRKRHAISICLALGLLIVSLIQIAELMLVVSFSTIPFIIAAVVALVRSARASGHGRLSDADRQEIRNLVAARTAEPIRSIEVYATDYVEVVTGKASIGGNGHAYFVEHRNDKWEIAEFEDRRT